MVDLSVVVPVYGCRDCLGALHQRLTAVLASLTDSYEIVLVDDRSPDAAWTVISYLVDRDPHVRALRFSRNFGQHAAITAGIAHSDGLWTVVMDCDLEDPPEAIARLYATAQEGHPLVLARRVERTHSRFRRTAAHAYMRVLNTFIGTRLNGEFGTFSILSRTVRDAYLSLGEQDRHYMFILNWLGFEPGVIEVAQEQRFAGRSSYTLRRLVSHALEGVFFQTATVLVWIIYFGFALAFGGGVLAVYYVYVSRVGSPPPGWTSLSVLLLIIGGFIISSTGVTGLYIAKVFQQVKDRPLYVVESTREATSMPSVRVHRAERVP